MDRTSELRAAAPATSPLYEMHLAGFTLSLGLILLTIVDFRRGFLFAEYVRSPYSAYHPAQLAMLLAGAAGLLVCYRYLASREAHEAVSPEYAKGLALVVAALLVIDLFTYRGVPAARAIAAGKLGADWLQAFGVTGWLHPIALSVSYLLTVWHATLLGVLLAGLALTALPAPLESLFARRGLPGTLAGTLYGIPQPFCSCCAAVMAPSYARRGASLDFSLAFVVGAPMLNITTMTLAFALLPAPYALLRLAAGLVLPLGVTYAVARLAERWGEAEGAACTTIGATCGVPVTGWTSRLTELYRRAFDVEAWVRGWKTDTPAALVRTWLYASVRIGMVLVPTLLLWSIGTAALVQLLPHVLSNSLPSVVLTAITGTLLMISTWTEIPIALQLIQSGFTGPAAAALVVLPPVSLPCLMVLAGALGRLRVTLLLGAAVMLIGVLAGVLLL